jgi:hypothetical protein
MLGSYLELKEEPQPIADNSGNKSYVPVSSDEVLSEDRVQLALKGIGKDHAVAIMDGGVGAPSATPLVASISLFMPESLMAMRSASAKTQFVSYTPSDEDKQNALTIQAHGPVGSTIQEGCTSITRVVLLSDPAGHMVKEAYYSEPSAQVWRNGFGATNQCDDLVAKFWLKDVEEVRRAAPNGEFFVAVFSGSVNTKTYKVKRKYQMKLEMK